MCLVDIVFNLFGVWFNMNLRFFVVYVFKYLFLNDKFFLCGDIDRY